VAVAGDTYLHVGVEVVVGDADYFHVGVGSRVRCGSVESAHLSKQLVDGLLRAVGMMHQHVCLVVQLVCG